VQPILGRVFTEQEARSGSRVLVLSYPVWKTRFASDPNILGKTVFLSAAPWTVVGVMPPDFSFVRNHDLWVPMELASDRHGEHNALISVAKLRLGVTRAQADAELDIIQQQIMREHPDVAASTFDSARTMPLRDIALDADVKRMMLLLLGAVGFVLLIACANVSHLLLVRGAERLREIAIYFSLGASRAYVVKQLLMEAAVLASLGAMAGLASAWCGVRFAGTLPDLQLPGTAPVSIEGGCWHLLRE